MRLTVASFEPSFGQEVTEDGLDAPWRAWLLKDDLTKVFPASSTTPEATVTW